MKIYAERAAGLVRWWETDFHEERYISWQEHIIILESHAKCAVYFRHFPLAIQRQEGRPTEMYVSSRDPTWISCSATNFLQTLSKSLFLKSTKVAFLSASSSLLLALISKPYHFLSVDAGLFLKSTVAEHPYGLAFQFSFVSMPPE